jgi:iron complex transport system substrate-binding protein
MIARRIAGGIAALALGLAALPIAAQDRPDSIVTLGGSVTEIVFALGAGDRVVARDSTSSFPAEVEALPDVGYVRALSPEGVLSVAPDLILAEEGAGPPETVTVLKATGVPYVAVPEDYSAQGITAKVLTVGAAIGENERAEALAAQIEADLKSATEALATDSTPKRVLFVLSTQGGRIMASGTGTAAAGMIAMAGGENAVTVFEGYKPLTDEAVIAAAPDVILMMDRGGEHDSSVEELVALPAVASTPAGQARAVVRMDGLYLLGFGPRTAQAVAELGAALQGG